MRRLAVTLTALAALVAVVALALGLAAIWTSGNDPLSIRLGNSAALLSVVTLALVFFAGLAWMDANEVDK